MRGAHARSFGQTPICGRGRRGTCEGRWRCGSLCATTALVCRQPATSHVMRASEIKCLTVEGFRRQFTTVVPAGVAAATTYLVLEQVAPHARWLLQAKRGPTQPASALLGRSPRRGVFLGDHIYAFSIPLASPFRRHLRPQLASSSDGTTLRNKQLVIRICFSTWSPYHHSNRGLVVEFSPATRETRVRFPAVAFLPFAKKLGVRSTRAHVARLEMGSGATGYRLGPGRLHSAQTEP